MKMLSYHPPTRTAGVHCLEPELGTQNCHLPTLTPARALGTNFPDSLDPQERGTPGGDGNQEGRSSELCWRRTGGRGAGQNPEAILRVGELGGNGGRPFGVPDDTLNGMDGMKRREFRKRNSRRTICAVCLLFYFDFFAFPLSLDNETKLVSFIPVSTKISFPSWFSDTCCCVLVPSPTGSVEKRAHSIPPVFLEFRAKRNSVTDTEFCFKKENLGGFENGGPNHGDRLLSGPDRGLRTSSCCFLLFSPCVYRARLVRDSGGLVQGMMTEQDSLSSPVRIPVACLSSPSAHPPSPRAHVPVTLIPSPSACSSSPPPPPCPPAHEARDASLPPVPGAHPHPSSSPSPG